VHNTGETSTWLKLDGTVPIYYEGVQYNIPVNVWLPEAFPLAAPLCFVTPDQSMGIKPRHAHVDQQGAVALPYLQSWNPNAGSNLIELVGIMSSVFGAEPPVYKRPDPAPRVSAAFVDAGVVVSSVSGGGARSRSGSSGASAAVAGASVSAAAVASASAGAAVVSPSPSPAAQLKAELTASVTARILDALKALRDDCALQIDLQTQTRAELVLSSRRLDECERALATRRDTLRDAELPALAARTARVAQWLAEHESRAGQPLDPDSVVCARDALSRQMLDLVAADAAAEDALNALHAAREQLELGAFLKGVRKLARDQFQARALAVKVLARQRELEVAR
jgi:ESCRT-I complex subunit TSG101